MPKPWTEAEADHSQEAVDLVAGPLVGELRWVPCEACGGSGEVIYSNPHFGACEPDERADLCGACEGTGRECVVVSPVECDDIVPEYTDAQFADVKREAAEDDLLAAGTHYLDANGTLQPKPAR